MKEYNYDAVEDWTPPSRIQIVSMIILAIALILVGVMNVRITDDVGVKVLSLFFLIGSGAFLLYLYAIRKGRPLIKSGTYTVSIQNGILKRNMKLYSEAKKIKVSEISEIQQSSSRIDFTLNDGSRHSFVLSQIKNPAKREEFVRTISGLEI